MDPDWLIMWRFLIGCSLFLFGLEKTIRAIKHLASDPIKQKLSTTRDSPLHETIFGISITAILVSNTVTMDLLTGLTALDLLSFSQAIHIMLGSEIGSTFFIQLMATPIQEWVAAPMIIGMVLFYTNIHPHSKTIGHLLFGLGLIFFALANMEQTLHPLRDHPRWGTILFDIHPGFALLATTLLTGLLRSSTATMGLVLVFAFAGLLSLTTAIAMTLGANLGSSLPILFNAMHQPRVAMRIALAHTTFKVISVCIAAWWLPQLAEWIHLFSSMPLTQEMPRQLALFHTLFNIGMVALGIPLVNMVMRGCEWVAPDPYSRESTTTDYHSTYWPKYLDDDLLSTPTLALAMARREVSLMATLLEEMMAMIPETVFKGDIQKRTKLQKMDDRVDEIHQAITRYLAKISTATPSTPMTDALLATMTVINELESIGDIIENNFSHLAEVCHKEQIIWSEEILRSLEKYHHMVHRALHLATAAFLANHEAQAIQVMGMKDEISDLDLQCRIEQMRSLQSNPHGEANFSSYTMQMDIYENFKRIYYHTKRIAKVVAKV
ncbi:MAG: Na/Pi symporter [Magnetococcus sp. YQC-5]